MFKQRRNRLSLLFVLLGLLAVLSSVASAGFLSIYAEFPQGAATFSRLPLLSYVTQDVETLTIQTPPTSDPDHQCVGNGSGQTEGTYTVWIPVSIPAGSIYLSTLGSNYDTIMTLYRYNPNVGNLTVIACNDDFDPISAVNAAYIAEIVPTGQYIFQISSVGTGAQTDLDLVINTEINPGTPPDYDYPSGGITITTVNAKAVKAPSAHLLSVFDGFDNDASIAFPCQMYNTAWYSFTPAFDGAYNFNTSNSRVYAGNNALYTDTVIQIVQEDLSSAPASCADGANFAQAYQVPLVGGVTYKIRVGTFNDINLLPPSSYALKVTTGEVGYFAGISMFPNFDFEIGDSSGWTSKNLNSVGDGVSILAPVAGTYSMEISAQNGVTKSLTKTVAFPKIGGFIPQKDDVFLARYSYRTVGTVAGVVQLKIQYSNRPPTVVKQPLVSNSVNSVLGASLAAVVQSKSVTKVTLTVQVKSGTGQLTFDGDALQYFGSASRAVSSVLPLPPAGG